MRHLAAAVLLSAVFGAAAEPGPFGLEWGQTPEQLRSNGGELVEAMREETLAVYDATSLPLNVSMASRYALFFDDKLGLQKVLMSSTAVERDPIGLRGKMTYSQLKRNLIEKYGRPANTLEKSGLKLYREESEFYECLKTTGCGFWTSLWTLKGGGGIQLQLKGLNADTGYVTLTYEGPMWGQSLDNRRRGNAAKDKPAL